MLPPTGEYEYRDHKKGLGSVRRKEDLQVTPTGSVQSVHGSQEEDSSTPSARAEAWRPGDISVMLTCISLKHMSLKSLNGH